MGIDEFSFRLTLSQALEMINRLEDEAEAWPDELEAEALWRAAYLLRVKYGYTVEDEN